MIRTEDIMLLCNQGLEMPELKNMIKAAQRKYVNERHTCKIYPLTSGPKKGRWKTYVYIDGNRKEIAGKTEDDVYESLYKHYSSLEESPKTLSDVFELLKDRKLNELARSEKTIREDVRLFNHLSESLRNKDLVEITESDRTPAGTTCEGETFVITGDVHIFRNRSELKTYIESQGGKVTGSVTGKTTFLINNDVTSTSGKNRKAQELGMPVISEEQFAERFGLPEGK